MTRGWAAPCGSKMPYTLDEILLSPPTPDDDALYYECRACGAWHRTSHARNRRTGQRSHTRAALAAREGTA